MNESTAFGVFTVNRMVSSKDNSSAREAYFVSVTPFTLLCKAAYMAAATPYPGVAESDARHNKAIPVRGYAGSNGC